MLVKDGNGTLIDFAWPSFWYLVKAGFAVTLGVVIASIVLFLPLLLLWLRFLVWIVEGFSR